MNASAKLIAGAAAVVLVAVIGYQLLPRNGGPGGQPTIAPSPSPSLLARGTFKVKGADVVLDATGGGSSASGTMTGSHDGVNFTVDLECTRTTDRGLLWIAGDVTASTDTFYAATGSRTAIVFRRGSPVQAVFVFQMNDPRSASCQAFIDDMTALEDPALTVEPIEGTVELAP